MKKILILSFLSLFLIDSGIYFAYARAIKKETYKKISVKKEDKYEKILKHYQAAKKQAKAMSEALKDSAINSRDKIESLKKQIELNRQKIADRNRDLHFKLSQIKEQQERQRKELQDKIFYQNQLMKDRIEFQKQRLADLRRK